MKYEFTDDVFCPECKCTHFRIESHVEKEFDGGPIVISWWDIYCDKCMTTITKIEM